METGTAAQPCMITEHEGFYGTIKNFTQDFVVIEIDMDGQLVNNEAPVPSPMTLDFSEKVTYQDSVIGEIPCHNTSPKETTGDACSSNNNYNNEAGNEHFDLNIILGSSVNKELEQFISKIRLCNEPSEIEMSIGNFQDKIQRASVHRSVRYNYPFLLTITQQTEIRVKEDKDFRDFLNLVSEEEVEGFFRFKDAKVPGSTFTFLPDGDKEHRTCIHHFVSSRFGKLVETKSFMAHGGTCITVRLRERGRPVKKRTLEVCEDHADSFTGKHRNIRSCNKITNVDHNPLLKLYSSFSCIVLIVFFLISFYS